MYKVTFIKPDANGQISPEAVASMEIHSFESYELAHAFLVKLFENVEKEEDFGGLVTLLQGDDILFQN